MVIIMNGYPEETKGVARYGMPPAVRPGSSPPAAQRSTTHLLALDHLAAGLRAASSTETTMTWAHVTQCTLRAAQDSLTPGAPAGDTLRRRMVLNDTLFDAFK